MIEAVPNVSEGRRPDVIETLAAAIAGSPGVDLLDTSSNAAHNRTVFTMVGEGAALRTALLSLYGGRGRSDRPQESIRASIPESGRWTSCPWCRWTQRTCRSASRWPSGLAAAVAERFDIPVYPLRSRRTGAGPAAARNDPPRRVRGTEGEDASEDVASRLRSAESPSVGRGFGHRSATHPDRVQRESGDRRPRHRPTYRPVGARIRPGPRGPSRRSGCGRISRTWSRCRSTWSTTSRRRSTGCSKRSSVRRTASGSVSATARSWVSYRRPHWLSAATRHLQLEGLTMDQILECRLTR